METVLTILNASYCLVVNMLPYVVIAIPVMIGVGFLYDWLMED